MMEYIQIKKKQNFSIDIYSVIRISYLYKLIIKKKFMHTVYIKNKTQLYFFVVVT